MALPGVTQTVRDGALGILASGSELHCKIGLCTSGDLNTALSFGDPQALRDALGRGPLVEAAVFAIEQTKKPVLCIRATQSAAGTIGAVSQTDTGPLITTSGSSPEDAYELQVKIVTGGPADEAVFQYSLDGGDTWSPEIAVADSYEGAEYEIPDSGIVIQFPEGTYVADENYSATCTPPSFDTTSLNTALTALIAATPTVRLVHVVGYASSAANSAVVATAASAKMTTAEGVYKYMYAVLEAADVSDTLLDAAFASFAGSRIMVCAGFEELVSAVSGRVYKRPTAWMTVARIMSSAVSRDPGAVADGPLAPVVSLYRDERATPALDVARFCTHRTYVGRPGFYVTRGRMMATPGSDFGDCPNRQVMDVACRTAYDALIEYVNFDLLLNPTTGKIDEAQAQAIEAKVAGKLRTALLSPDPKDASDVTYVLSRTENILSTQTLRGKTRVTPKGYARFIENEIAFRNPALEAAPAA